MKLTKNILLNTDSYKTSMWQQLPIGTTNVYSYIESRGGRYNQTVFFGLQAFIKEYLLRPITQEDIDIADEIITAHGLPFNRRGWQYILDTHQGFLPMVIKAVPEGTVVPIKNVLATIENTDPNCAWLTTYLETALLRAVWYGTTVATQSWNIKQVIKGFLESTGDPAAIDFKLHDFSARGVSSMETSGIGSAAHLVNFSGTDSITGVLYAREFYNAGVSGFSISASEHSISTAYEKNERQYVLTMLDNFAKPGAIFAVVADTYNVFEFCKMLGDDAEIFKRIVTHGKTGGLMVVRPDSGDPVAINQQLIEILGSKFGYSTNSKGFKVLNYVRIIQGDGVNELSIRSILGGFKAMGWSADNIAFGMGGALCQAVDRDTQKFAQKASAVCINGKWKAVFKDPITDSGKRSKQGRVMLYKANNQFTSGIEDNQPNTWNDKSAMWEPALTTVFENGVLTKEYEFAEIRANANQLT